MNKNIQTIVTFIASQMDGQPVPPAGSAALDQLSAAIGELQRHQSGQELQLLALHTINAVVDRVRGNIEAQATLQKFITGGNHA